MKSTAFTLLIFAACVFSVFAEDKNSDSKKSFAKHSAEIQITPSADYLIFNQGNIDIDKPYEGRLPFIGVGAGVQYVFRPIRMLGVSTGVQFRMHGSYSRQRVFPLIGNSYIAQRGNAHLNYVSIPLYIHLYKRMTNCTFEFAIGPDFNIPVFRRYTSTTFAPNGDELVNSSGLSGFSSDDMQKLASFGLSIFLGGLLDMGSHANLFIGPQIQFLDLARFNSDTRKIEQVDGRFYNCALGLKLGFRFF